MILQYKNDMRSLEQNQCKAMKMVKELENLVYREGLRDLRLLSLERKGSGRAL